MRALLLLCAATLAACATSPTPPAAAGASVTAAPEDGVVQPTAKPALSNEVLPSMELTGTLREDSDLLQRPRNGSVVLQRLAAGTRVTLLGTLDNPDGRWQSVGLGDQQGWVRADRLTQNP